MKILVDCSNIRTGGALQNGLALLALARNDHRHQWHAIVSRELGEQVPAEWAPQFASYHRIAPVRTWRDFLRMGSENRALEAQLQPDLVFTLAGPVYWQAKAPHVAGFARAHYLYPEIDLFRQLRLSVALPARLKLRFLLAVHRFFFRRADYLIGQTTTVQQRAAKALGFPADRFYVARNSYSPLFRRQAEALRATVRPEETRAVIFVPSAYYVHKNLEIVPDTARVLLTLTKRPFVFRFTLPPESTEWQALRARAEALDVATRLDTVGKVPHGDLARRYLESHVVFLPTLLECSTAVYPEAMSAAVPIVTTDLDFARETCGEAALYFPPYDAVAAATRLAGLLNSRPDRQALVDRGQAELLRIYPSPEAKFEEQLAALQAIAKREGVPKRA